MVEDALRAAGWFAGRTTDISDTERAVTERGYALSDALRAFLAEFSGLTLHVTRHGRDDTVWFDATRAISWADPESVRVYAARVGTSLVPVGYAHHDHLLLMIGEDARLVGAYDDYVTDLGSPPMDALGRLLSQEGRPV